MRTETAAPSGNTRRRWLAGVLASSMAPTVCAAGPDGGPAGRAAGGFDAATLDGAMDALGGMPAPTTGIALSLADVVEDGAHAAVKVVSSLPGTTEIALVVEMNPTPLVVRFTLPPGTAPEVAVRVKLAQSGPVWAVVRAQGRLYCASRHANVTTSACAG